MSRSSWSWLAALSSGVVIATTAIAITAASHADITDLSVRITSPLGRTGGVGTVRIVAQIQRPPGATLNPVRFYVDGTLFKTDDDGPPYAVEWMDENPFERRELAVEVDDSEGHKGRDNVVLAGVRDHRNLGSGERAARGRCLRPQGPVRERSEPRPASRSRKTAWRRRSISSATSGSRRRLRCSSTAARACRAASTS